MVPALVYAERDRLEERVSAEEEQAVVDATRELLGDLGVVRDRWPCRNRARQTTHGS